VHLKLKFKTVIFGVAICRHAFGSRHARLARGVGVGGAAVRLPGTLVATARFLPPEAGVAVGTSAG
jgi:hypothetical protein